MIKEGIQLFHRYITNKFVRFLFVGSLNTLFGLSVYCLMIFIGLPYIWATLVSQILGVLFNFMTTGTLVFENSDKRLLVKFTIAYLITYFVSIGTNKSFQLLLDCNEYISGIGAAVITALFSYFLLKIFVYKK